MTRAISAGLHEDPAQLLQDDRPPFGQGDAGLGPEELEVAAVEAEVVVRQLLVNEDRPHLGQRPRVLEEERVADRRDKVVEAVIALQESPRPTACPRLRPPTLRARTIASHLPLLFRQSLRLRLQELRILPASPSSRMSQS